MIRFALIILLLITPLFAKILLTDDSYKYDEFQIGYLHDHTNSLTIEEIINTPFKKNSSNRFTFGYIEKPVWFKLELENSSNIEEYVISFNEVLWKNFDLYYQKNGIWIEKINGLDIPLIQREIKDVNPAFDVVIEKGTTCTFYIKGKTISGQLGKFEIFTHDEYFNPTRINLMNIYVSFAFVLLGIILLNIYSFILTRNISYVYYIAYMISSVVFSTMHSGSYLILGFDGWNEGLHIVGAVLSLFLLLFTDKFLEFKKKFPLIHNFFMFSVGMLLIFIILIYNNVAYSSKVFNIYAILFYSVLFIGVVKTFLKGSVSAKYYLIALIIYLPLMGLMIATFNTFLPYSDFSRHAFIVGAFIEIVMFTFILTSKYRSVNLEKISIQEELLREKSKNEAYLEREISKRTKELQELASIDSMTKLYNRRYFTEISVAILDLAIRNESSLSIMMIDIDDFKSINDRFGHTDGDQVIIRTAKVLQECSRKSDIVSRWGGEEFLILLPDTDIEGSLVIARKILKAIAIQDVALSNDKVTSYTVSIGVSMVDISNDKNLEASIYRADKALYEAKESGKNRISQKLF